MTGTCGSKDGGLRPAAAGARLGNENGSEVFAGLGAVEVGGGQAHGSEPADGDPLGGGERRAQGAKGTGAQAGHVQGECQATSKLTQWRQQNRSVRNSVYFPLSSSPPRGRKFSDFPILPLFPTPL